MPACQHLTTPNSHEFGYSQLRRLLATVFFCSVAQSLIAADTVIYKTAKDPAVQVTVTYQQAVRDEKRVRVQRQVMAKLAGTYCQLEQFDSARDVFLSLLRSTATATVEEVEGWLARLPADLRAGPYFALGQAWSARGQSDKSALACLRVPILYGQDRRLVASALLLAGRELEKIGQREEAVTLYREVAREHAAAPSAAEARGRLEELAGREKE